MHSGLEYHRSHMHFWHMYSCIYLSVVLLYSGECFGFLPQKEVHRDTYRHKAGWIFQRMLSSPANNANDNDLVSLTDTLAPDIARQFKILTCSSTSCAQKRQRLGLDEYSTFAALYMRAQAMAPTLTVQECPCLGQCKTGPCVAIEHEDYEGTVSLEGMTRTEFADRVFQNIVTEEDADRVWASVVNAVQVLEAEAQQQDEDKKGKDDLNDHERTESEGVEV